MKTKRRFHLLALLVITSIIVPLVTTSCEKDECNLILSVFPSDEGNFVHVYKQEFINEEGELQELQTGDMDERALLLGIPFAATYRIPLWVKKVRLEVIPGPGYRFDHWEFEDFTRTGDFLEITVLPGEDLYISAHFVPIPSVPGESPSEWATPEESGDPSDWGRQEYPADTALSAVLLPKVEIIEGPSGCISSFLTVDYAAIDISGGNKPVDFVQLKKDGEELHTWNGVPTTHFQDDAIEEVPCMGVTLLQLIAINTDNEEVRVTEEIHIPPVVSSLTWDIEEVPGEECQMKLILDDFWGADNTGPNRQLTSLVLTANGIPWYEMNNLNTDFHQHSISKVVYCGQIYTLELTATDVDGNKYTWRETVTIPTPEPQEEPPPQEPPPQEPPPDAPPAEETLYVAFIISGQCMWSEAGCICTVGYSIDAEDRSAGDKYPVTNVKLEVNDGTGWKEWHNSGGISTPAYHYPGQKTGVACDKTFNVRVIATNSIGQTVTATGTFTTTSPSL